MKKNLICFDECYIVNSKKNFYSFLIKNWIKHNDINDFLIFSKNKNGGQFLKKKFSFSNFIKGFFLIDNKIKLIQNISQIYCHKILRQVVSDKKFIYEFKPIRIAKVFIITCCYYEFFLKKAENYDNLINICYYNSLNLAATYCFKKIKNKKVVDIQHGYIGKKHPAYALCKKNNYLIPDVLKVWKNQQLYFLKNFFKLEKFNYPLSVKKKEKNDKIVIGISLQTFPFNSNLISIIQDLQKVKNIIFSIRGHPVDKISTKLRKDLTLIKNQKNIKFSSNKKENIFNWLAKINLHITANSSVIIEASFSKILTLTYEKKTIKMFSNIINIDKYLKFINLKDLKTYILNHYDK